MVSNNSSARGNKKERKGGGITNRHKDKKLRASLSAPALPHVKKNSFKSLNSRPSTSRSIPKSSLKNLQVLPGSGRLTPISHKHTTSSFIETSPIQNVKNSKPLNLSSALSSEGEFTTTLSDNQIEQRLGDMKRLASSLRHARAILIQKTLRNECYTKFKSLTDMFKSIDSDKGGKMDFQEFWKVLENNKLDNAVNQADAREIFSTVDKDHSGAIEFPEFLSMFKDPESMEEHHEDGSNLLTNKKGYLKPNIKEKKFANGQCTELKQRTVDAITRSQNTSKVVQNNSKFLSAHFKAFDANGDGVLTYEEVSKALGNKHLNLGLDQTEIRILCAALDKNDDGTISIAEFINELAVIGYDPGYNPVKEGRKRQLETLKEIVEKPIEWRNPAEEITSYDFDFVETKDVRSKHGFMHPPSLQPLSSALMSSASSSPMNTQTTNRGNTAPNPHHDTGGLARQYNNFSSFLKEWEMGSPRQRKVQSSQQRTISRSLAENTFGAKVTSSSDIATRRSIFADIESPLTQLRNDVVESIVFNQLDDINNEAGKAFREASSTKLKLQGNNISLTTPNGLLTSPFKRFRTTSATFLAKADDGTETPWSIASISNASKRAARINRIRKNKARLKSYQDLEKTVTSQNDARRLRTRSKVRRKYYLELQRKEDRKIPIKKVANLEAARKHFGTSKESMLFIPFLEGK